MLTCKLIEGKDFDSSVLDQTENREHELTFDARLKMVEIFNRVKELSENKEIPENFSLLDVGAGSSHIAAIIKQRLNAGYTKAIDLHKVWGRNADFGVETQICDFSSYTDDKKYDVIIDCCAVHEVNPRKEENCKHIGLKHSYEKIYNLLNDGGYFVTSSDCYEEDQNLAHGITEPETMLEIAQQVGFKTSELIKTNPFRFLIDLNERKSFKTNIINFVIQK
jgi:SAM-dependent methyltransferase